MSRKRKALPANKRKKFRKTKGRAKKNVLKNQDYSHYLQSALWQHARKFVMARDDHRCQCCTNPATEVHHISYETAVMEGRALERLISLCHECHMAIELEDGVHVRDISTKRDRLAKLMHEKCGVPLEQWEALQKQIVPSDEWHHERQRKLDAWNGKTVTPIPRAPDKTPKKIGKTARRTADRKRLEAEVALLRKEREVYEQDMQEAHELRQENNQLKRRVHSLEKALCDARKKSHVTVPDPVFPLGHRVMDLRQQRNLLIPINPKEIA